MIFLVTGCSSYIAKYTIQKLLLDDDQVYGISRTNPAIEHRNFYWLPNDLSKDVFTGGVPSIDIVIHIAAQSLLGKSAKEYLNSNIILTNRVCEMARELKPKVIIFTSSMKVYGEIRVPEATENIDIINPDLYGMTKYFGEKILQEALPTIALRMPGVIGVGSHGWIDGVYKKLKNNEPLAIFNSGYNHVVHVQDIYGIIRSICNKEYFKNEVFNVCASGISNSFEVVHFIKNALSSKSAIDVKKGNGGMVHVISNKKLSGLYKPIDVQNTISLYVKEMTDYENENRKDS